MQSPQQLQVAPKGASAELEGLTGVWAAVKCLVAVGSSNVDLIRAHARSAPACSSQQALPYKTLECHRTSQSCSMMTETSAP